MPQNGLKTKVIYFVVYPGFELLDLSGPVSVYYGVNYLLESEVYDIRLISVKGGLIKSACGISVETQSFPTRSIYDYSVFIVGAFPDVLIEQITQGSLIIDLKKICQQANEFGSICSGSFLLAATGLLDNRKCATHWMIVEEFKKSFPKVHLLTDVLYVHDEDLWTSAGVTTGIDLMLEIVRNRHGLTVMREIAEALIVDSVRHAEQQQKSDLLLLQTKMDKGLSDLLSWLQNNLHKKLTVEDLAGFCNTSTRNFYRQFERATGMSPGNYLLKVKMEKARSLLESGISVNAVCNAVGYQSLASFRKKFHEYFDILPSKISAVNQP